jgi:hypothetical protein
MPLEPITSYTWPTDAFPLAALAIRVDALAHRLGVAVQTWVEDGLGPARGFGVRLPSGRVYLFEELETSVLHHGARGPNVYVDAGALAEVGVMVLLAELLEACGLVEGDLATDATGQVQELAAAVAARVKAHRKQ